jgi:PTH1 family peptidyl-tRNA hydrolase
MKVIVGLGNPGREYENTRHNAGFRLVDQLATAFGAELKVNRALACQIAKVGSPIADVAGAPNDANDDLLLVKPTTYMNLSGQAVRRVLHWYKIKPAENILLVVHDDVSLNMGRIRFQTARGAGGQHGVESIIESLSGSKQFDRLKLGVGPDPGGAERGNFVLRQIGLEEKPIFDRVLEESCQAVKVWLKSGGEEAANRFNGIDYAS